MNRYRYLLCLLLSIHFSACAIDFMAPIKPLFTRTMQALYYLASYFIPATYNDLLQTKKEILEIFKQQHMIMQNTAYENVDLFFQKSTDALKDIEIAIHEQCAELCKIQKIVQKNEKMMLQQIALFHMRRMHFFKQMFQEYVQKTIILNESLTKKNRAHHNACIGPIQQQCQEISQLLLSIEKQNQELFIQIKNKFICRIKQQKKYVETKQEALRSAYNKHESVIHNMQQQCAQFKGYFYDLQKKSDELYHRVASLFESHKKNKTSSSRLHGYAVAVFDDKEKQTFTQGML